MDERFEELKRVLLNWGRAAIEDFLGYTLSESEENDAIIKRLEAAYQKTPCDIMEVFYAKYEIW